MPIYSHRSPLYNVGKVIDPGTPPVMGQMPAYTAPAWDEEEIKGLAQTYAAPGLRGLRMQMGRESAKSYTNPNVKRMTLREALAGYGAGLESVTSGARRAAAGEYAQKYGTEERAARLNYEGEMKKGFMEYQTAYADYMAKEARKPIYGGVKYGTVTTPTKAKVTPSYDISSIFK